MNTQIKDLSQIPDTLPNTRSKLILLALKDLNKSIKQGITINMGIWFNKAEGTDYCYACLAGCVIAQELIDIKAIRKTWDNLGIAPHYLSARISEKLCFLDFASQGLFKYNPSVFKPLTRKQKSFLIKLEEEWAPKWVRWETDQTKFRKNLRMVALQIKEQGL